MLLLEGITLTGYHMLDPFLLVLVLLLPPLAIIKHVALYRISYKMDVQLAMQSGMVSRESVTT